MNERRCETCRWWRRQRPDSILGECTVPLDPEPLLPVQRLRTEAASCQELWEEKLDVQDS